MEKPFFQRQKELSDRAAVISYDIRPMARPVFHWFTTGNRRKPNAALALSLW
jgi:hypothetical protein